MSLHARYYFKLVGIYLNTWYNMGAFDLLCIKYVTLNHSGLLGPERYLGIYSLDICRTYIFKAVNSILIINILRSSYIYIKL